MSISLSELAEDFGKGLIPPSREGSIFKSRHARKSRQQCLTRGRGSPGLRSKMLPQMHLAFRILLLISSMLLGAALWVTWPRLCPFWDRSSEKKGIEGHWWRLGTFFAPLQVAE